MQKNVATKQKRDTMPMKTGLGGVADVHFVTHLDIEKYGCVSKHITTDEVIITDERIQHIQEHHPNDYERYQGFLKNVIDDPDYILEAALPQTAFLLKEIQEADEKFQLILRLKVTGDPEEYKNSVITFLKISEKKWKKYLRNKKILYKRE
ncbi:MAG: PBECR2 nuclease fold domain-containing protein [Oscillospiraceae bacterium]